MLCMLSVMAYLLLPLQMLIQTMFEWVLLLTSAVASLAYNRGWISTVAAVLALFVLVVKVKQQIFHRCATLRIVPV